MVRVLVAIAIIGGCGEKPLPPAETLVRDATRPRRVAAEEVKRLLVVFDEDAEGSQGDESPLNDSLVVNVTDLGITTKTGADGGLYV